jgi:2-amino-4-hydroxy-6-hydroxymethyldihydropteridine diphosphokinase
MPVAYLGIGSNLDAEENIQLAVRELRERFSVQKISTVYRSKALGFAGADFLNMVVSIETKISPTVLCGQLEQIHELAGRRRQSEKFIARTLDIDLLLYDQLVVNEAPVRLPRKDVLQYSFVLLQHWQEFDAAAHPLTAVDIAL